MKRARDDARVSESVEETLALGEEIGRRLLPDGVLLLYGDLGAGKTVLAKGVARAVGVPDERVQSPTFTLIAEHEGARGRLTHIDLYRLAPEEVWAAGVEEALCADGVKVVEWSERLPFAPEEGVGVERWRLRRVGTGRRELRRLPGPEAADGDGDGDGDEREETG